MDTVKTEDKPNPRESANILSVLSFWWTIALFKKGYYKDLAEEDLYSPLKKDKSEYLGDKLEVEWERQVKKKKPSLLTAIVKSFRWEYTILGLFHAVNDLVIRLTQPLLLGKLLEYFKPESDMPKNDAYLYAAGIVISHCCSTLYIILLLMP